jgi:SNF2 family DNA or RNA helicase
MDRYDWQVQEVAQYGHEEKRGIFASPRLGKTLTCIDTMDTWHVGRMIVCAPLLVCPQWENELRAAGYQVSNMYSGSHQARVSRMYAERPDVVVINYDVLGNLMDDLIAWKPEALIGDESHLIKGVSSQRGQAFRRLAWRVKYVRLLTGTPAPNHYGDLWGQLVALDKVGWQSYTKFADRYLIRHAMFPSKVIGHRNVEELQQRLLRYVSIVRRDDVFGPDHWQYVTRTIPLDGKAKALYQRLSRDWILDDEGVSAEHILTRLIRLQQLSAGFLPSDTGETLEVHDSKINAVLADLDEIVESGEKAVLFHRFTWEGNKYHEEMAKRFPGVPLFRIDGDVPAADRFTAINSFRDCTGSALAVVQTQAGGVGISFATATHALFTSRDFSYTNDQQARDRIFAPGARRVVTYYETDRTVDQFIAKVLAEKRNVHDSVTNADRAAMAYGPIGV